MVLRFTQLPPLISKEYSDSSCTILCVPLLLHHDDSFCRFQRFQKLQLKINLHEVTQIECLEERRRWRGNKRLLHLRKEKIPEDGRQRGSKRKNFHTYRKRRNMKPTHMDRHSCVSLFCAIASRMHSPIQLP